MAKKYGDYRSSVKEGKAAEELFIKALASKYPSTNPRPSTYVENYKEHKDVVAIGNNGSEVHFDVKNAKRVIRRNGEESGEFTWVELQNNQGRPGWLYGKQKYIAFKDISQSRFVVVEREELITLMEGKVKTDVLYTENNNIPPYGRYQRVSSGNKDIIVLTPLNDLYSIEKFGVEFSE